MPSTTIQGASFPLKRLCARASNYRDGQYPGLSYAVSIGVSEVSRDEQVRTTLHNVETALTSASTAGGACVVFHEHDYCLMPDAALAQPTN
jgi:hypothetical protein